MNPNKKKTKRQLNKGNPSTKTSNKSNAKKIKRFNKAQMASLRNSPMFVKKREAAEKFFSSPAYKSIERDQAVTKKIKGGKNKNQ